MQGGTLNVLDLPWDVFAVVLQLADDMLPFGCPYFMFHGASQVARHAVATCFAKKLDAATARRTTVSEQCVYALANAVHVSSTTAYRRWRLTPGEMLTVPRFVRYTQAGKRVLRYELRHLLVVALRRTPLDLLTPPPRPRARHKTAHSNAIVQ